ncbi:TIGR03084 family metal-binding protein [Gordonia sp. OPL2]|uniref:TIGR03084 family metal-binding protein n=1 Tax=Gordonia sp. OPL2 TaxID=2486274 RepID=UPI0016560C1B|nr:TIGR03084 family metal-binding protein [Gordonia sp. OPL2]ROZ89480.1 TIGR03084 family protein [Gordonia sp. OPL2]
MSIVDGLVADLTDESGELDALVAALDDDGWRMLTPAPGWTVAHQIGHLAWTDKVAAIAATDADGFAAVLEDGATNPAGFVDAAAERAAAAPPAQILADWRDARAALADALRDVPDGVKIPWFGPPMSAASMATARLMETWAHGLDVADAFGVTRAATDRIKGVVHIGVRTRDFAYMVNGLTAPTEPFRYEITAPSGELWTWGPDDAADVIRGTAVDFCQLVTQRRAIADLDLDIVGAEAHRWTGIAQSFAGPPGAGREPRRDGAEASRR